MRLYDQVLADIFRHKYAFFGVFFIVLLVSYGFLFAIDFIPETPETVSEADAPEVTVVTPIDRTPTATPNASERESVDPLPVRVIIDAIDKDIEVLNPQGRSVEALDAALLKGVVRHPDSADFTDEGNMFLFGHSSYLPNVLNKNFQAFNGIQNLKWGDTILVQSGDREYEYRVTKVYKTLASEATITLDNSSAKLTLATCNSFGSKDDRFIVEADLVESRAL